MHRKNVVLGRNTEKNVASGASNVRRVDPRIFTTKRQPQKRAIARTPTLITVAITRTVTPPTELLQQLPPKQPQHQPEQHKQQ